mmetsp:Transcript_1190/g.4102  ORF Transcript_1190/g.4102 Transcript_1190/m.4102 type:complete len:301 (-) Transcript_1190:98-1000(-)|eukprot:CAMPEP_0117443416 /NCGR_PEP_ID=MMETSP0759-20121206/4683_1 /TAXON_ID=63605 /ORGANISM="Percolomonas cosmopolitus, Strain WS" /LENGTH=300 /DNA_ID=CAMNT_0005235389 /DNA_START=432 /DNA_END=1334 /DNA_ORIENTATION=+
MSTSQQPNTTTIELLNLLYLGSYDACISQCTKLANPSIAHRILELRANIALGQNDYVLEEVESLDSSDKNDTGVKAVELFAQYQKAQESREQLISQLEQWLDDPSRNANPTLLVIAATIYTHEGNPIAALKALHHASNLEMFHVLIVTLLRINRVDLAQDALKRMQDMNDDATLTHLTSAMVALQVGGPEKVQEAQYLYQELNQKFGDAVVVLNGLALTHMTLGEFEEAEQFLQTALTKKSQDVDSLINMIVCQTHMKNDRQVKRYMTQLKAADADNQWLKDRKQKSDDFDSQMGSYAQK